MLESYDYPLDPSLIAATPAHPRESAKLLVYNSADNTTAVDTFAHIGNYLPKNSLLVLNDTKVIPARICMQKKRISPDSHSCENQVIFDKLDVLFTRLDRGLEQVECLIPKHCADGTELTFPHGRLTVLSKKDGVYTARLESEKNINDILNEYGTTPIPPYLKHTPLTEQDLREEYQAVWAKYEGSAAAPTASLHFTHQLLEQLKEQGVEIAYVTLHVGLGTFAPVTKEHLEKGILHKEWYEVPAATIAALKEAKTVGRAIIPVGTTALRTLESLPEDVCQGDTLTIRGETELFIQPGYKFKLATSLITNFHVPKSSLLMLVAALTGKEKLFELYAYAQKNNFRFFSFGDGMLIL